MILDLPVEILCKIFKYLSYDDIRNLNKIEKFSSLIEKNITQFSRKTASFTITGNDPDNLFDIESSKISVKGHALETLCSMTRSTSMKSLIIRKLREDDDAFEKIDFFLSKLIIYRQNDISSLSLIDIEIPKSRQKLWANVFMDVLRNSNLKSLSMDNVSLCGIFNHRIFKSFKNIRDVKWLVNDIDDFERIKCGDNILGMFSNHIRYSSPLKLESQSAHIQKVSCDSLLSFIETWLSISSPSPFNITIENCDQKWIENFYNECVIRKLSTFNMQIGSTRYINSHVKMNFIETEDNIKVVLSSVVDMPARTINQRISHGRFYRDF
uniref:F-box domain-containing protein n=1 Tax=Parastrongyloides trichosuri TaxID=131310 RepID=A0A0N5A361_PARTI